MNAMTRRPNSWLSDPLPLCETVHKLPFRFLILADKNLQSNPTQLDLHRTDLIAKLEILTGDNISNWQSLSLSSFLSASIIFLIVILLDPPPFFIFTMALLFSNWSFRQKLVEYFYVVLIGQKPTAVTLLSPRKEIKNQIQAQDVSLDYRNRH